MNVGYAPHQHIGLGAQARDLMAGAERTSSEQVSSAAERVKLAECLAFLRDGDALTVTSQTGSETDLSKRDIRKPTKPIGRPMMAGDTAAK